MSFSPRRFLSESMNYDRTVLDEELDWLTVDHDDFQKEISERIRSPLHHPSMSVIDQWEEETIQRIRHTALLARRTLFNALNEHLRDVQERLNNLTRKLDDARMGVEYFNENDINEWAMTLRELKRTPEFPVLVDPHMNIQGITMELRKYQPSISLNSTSPGLISTLRDFLLPIIDSPKRTEPNRNEVHVNNDTSSNPSRIIPSKAVTFQEQPTKNTPTTTRIRRAHAEIPFNSNTNYSLRGPATIYH